MAALTENSRKIFDYVRSMRGENITAVDIADGVGLTSKQVNGSVTAFQRKGLLQRTPAEVEMPDGTHKTVKFISETEKGKAFDPDAPVEDKNKAE